MRNFANSLILPFKGATSAQPITAHRKSNQPPQVVSLDIPWRAYALDMVIGGGVTTFNAGVSIDISRGTVANPLDIIKSVFIDNTGVDRPVYLQVADTGQTISCADGTTGWYPLSTNGEQFILYTDNIIPLRDANQKTKIIFSNASFDTFSGGELNRAQSLFRASGTSSFITPVLGDKLKSSNLNAGNTANLFPIDNTKTIIITSIKVTAANGSPSNYPTSVVMYADTDIILIGGGAYSAYASGTIVDLQNLQISYPGKAITLVNGGSITQYYFITYAEITLPALSA